MRHHSSVSGEWKMGMSRSMTNFLLATGPHLPLMIILHGESIVRQVHEMQFVKPLVHFGVFELGIGREDGDIRHLVSFGSLRVPNECLVPLRHKTIANYLKAA